MSTPSTFQHLIDTQDDEALARILRNDQEICSADGKPSLLAVQLTGITQGLAGSIASHLLGHDGTTKVPRSVLRLQYKEVLGGIKAHAQRLYQSDAGTAMQVGSQGALTTSELKITLRVLRVLTDDKPFNPKQSLDYAINYLESRLKGRDEPAADDAHEGVKFTFSYYPTCYICHTRLSASKFLPRLPVSLPAVWIVQSVFLGAIVTVNLSLNDKSVLVNGGRLNLGCHTAVRLLHCGARVIVTSRYPLDAGRRYRERTDFPEWQERLRIVGADFRTDRDVFRLAAVVRKILAEWYQDSVPRLDILINNAAQTLTDSGEAERKAIAQETKLRDVNTSSSLPVDCDGGYIPRVGGRRRIDGLKTPSAHTMSRHTKRPESSWTQTLAEIPYEDVISAHSVNTFVPLILIRELLPLVGIPTPTDTAPAAPIAGYIINVTSHEGIFDSSLCAESRLRQPRHHVHTNMSNAALNMITETEAAACWHGRHVCMNCVNPGYMSATPGFGREGHVPLGWEDGAGRGTMAGGGSFGAAS